MSQEDIKWHEKLNILDIRHDAIGFYTTPLFYPCLNGREGLYPGYENDPDIATIEFDEYPALELVVWHDGTIIRPSQIDPALLGVWDMFSPSTVGMEQKITPSYYFDSASRTYDKTKKNNIFKKLLKYKNEYNGMIDLNKFDLETL